MFSLGKNKKSFKSLEEASKKVEELEAKISEISRELEDFKKEGKIFFQKLGLRRYNPFSGMGGDQSFSLALLDENNDGFVITSIFINDNSRIFAKPIIKGESGHQLSKEEKETIEQAKNSKTYGSR
jgi:hypothetical protein